MKNETFREILRGIAHIYGNIIKKTGIFLAFLAGAIVLAAAIVLPIWYFADKHRNIYSLVVLSVIAAGILFLIVRNGIRKRSLQEKEYGKSRLLRIVWRFFAGILFLLWLYGIVVVLLRGMIGVTILMIILLLAAFGFFLYGKYKSDVGSTS